MIMVVMIATFMAAAARSRSLQLLLQLGFLPTFGVLAHNQPARRLRMTTPFRNSEKPITDRKNSRSRESITPF